MRVCYYTINNSLDDNGCTHFILRNETSTLLSKAQILYMLSVTEICSLFCIKRYNIHVQSPGKHLILYSKLSYSEVQEILCWKCHFAPNLKLSSLFSNINAIVNLFFFLSSYIGIRYLIQQYIFLFEFTRSIWWNDYIWHIQQSTHFFLANFPKGGTYLKPNIKRTKERYYTCKWLLPYLTVTLRKHSY